MYSLYSIIVQKTWEFMTAIRECMTKMSRKKFLMAFRKRLSQQYGLHDCLGVFALHCIELYYHTAVTVLFDRRD